MTCNKNRFALWISTWFGCGFLKFAPGTIGSMAAVPFAWMLMEFGGVLALTIVTTVLFLIGVWAAHTYVLTVQNEDPPEVVIDEVVGQCLTLMVVPVDVVYYLIGFVLFRIFDIIKPWPVNWADKNIKGGLGIMLDDILAGVYAGLALWVIQFWI